MPPVGGVPGRSLPPIPVKSSAARSSGNARGTPPPVRPAPPTPAERTLNAAIQRMWQGPAQPFLAPMDPIARHVSPVPRQLMMRGQFNQDFSALQNAGMLPRGAREPQLAFPARGMGRGGGLSYENNGKVFLSQPTVDAATSLDSPERNWGLETPIHEIAHALQLQDVLGSVPLREGGAQAFADAAVPRVLGPIPTHDTNYANYVRQVRALGAPWYMRGQFGAGAGTVIASPRRTK